MYLIYTLKPLNMKNKLLFLAMGLALSTQMIYAQVPSYVPSNGLVGYWPFNGDANDVSVNGNSGTNNGATLTTDRFGNANSAYIFNGSGSYINIPNSTALQFSGGITFSVWFNATNISVGAVNSTSYLMSKGSDGLATSWISFLDTSAITLLIYNNSNTLSNWATVPSSQLIISTNQWYNATFTFDGTNARAYINGQLKSTLASTYTSFSNIYDLKFGRRHTSGLPYFFNGKLDDIGVWNRALTQDEITSLYYAENTCQSLVINTGLLSFNPPTYQNTVTIYPNPANDQITIDCGTLANVTGWKVKISNSLGQEVFTGEMNTQQHVVPLNSWGGQGIYFVKIYDASDNLMNTKKIILQ
jgi:hypothetical protein